MKVLSKIFSKAKKALRGDNARPQDTGKPTKPGKPAKKKKQKLKKLHPSIVTEYDLELYNRMKAIELEFLMPHSFAKFKNYWLPENLVKSSRNVLSFGVHRDVGFEQAMCDINPSLNIHCYDPTPDTVEMFKGEFPHKDKITYHNKAYANFQSGHENKKLKFYYDAERPQDCFSLLPVPHFKKLAHIEVDTVNLESSLQDVDGEVDIIKADIEGVWFDFCREVLDMNLKFKAFAIEFEVKLIDNEKSMRQYRDILSEFKSKGYQLFLNRSRNKTLSEAIIIPKDQPL